MKTNKSTAVNVKISSITSTIYISEADASVYVQVQKWIHMWGQYTPKRHKACVSEKQSYKVLKGHFKLSGLNNYAHMAKSVAQCCTPPKEGHTVQCNLRAGAYWVI